ncbi:MAG: hypothetical protein ACPGQQ_04825 [Candidatus Puniceispirillaceae bacterium]
MDYEKEKVVNGLREMKFEDLHGMGQYLAGCIEDNGDEDIDPTMVSFWLLGWAKREAEIERERKQEEKSND